MLGLRLPQKNLIFLWSLFKDLFSSVEKWLRRRNPIDPNCLGVEWMRPLVCTFSLNAQG